MQFNFLDIYCLSDVLTGLIFLGIGLSIVFTAVFSVSYLCTPHRFKNKQEPFALER